MKTYDSLNKRQPRNQLPPKSVQNSGKRFRHRDRGTHVGRAKGT